MSNTFLEQREFVCTDSSFGFQLIRAFMAGEGLWNCWRYHSRLSYTRLQSVWAISRVYIYPYGVFGARPVIAIVLWREESEERREGSYFSRGLMRPDGSTTTIALHILHTALPRTVQTCLLYVQHEPGFISGRNQTGTGYADTRSFKKAAP